jgi:hypothetical protein
MNKSHEYYSNTVNKNRVKHSIARLKASTYFGGNLSSSFEAKTAPNSLPKNEAEPMYPYAASEISNSP